MRAICEGCGDYVPVAEVDDNGFCRACAADVAAEHVYDQYWTRCARRVVDTRVRFAECLDIAVNNPRMDYDDMVMAVMALHEGRA
jgi:hypothetical protein